MSLRLKLATETDLGVVGQKIAYGPSFVGREIVADDVNLFSCRLICNQVGKKGHELRAGMPRNCLAHNLPEIVLNAAERERAVAVILKPMAFGASGRRGSTGSSRFSAGIAFFWSTQNTAACVWRVQMQPENVGRLSLKVRMV